MTNRCCLLWGTWCRSRTVWLWGQRHWEDGVFQSCQGSVSVQEYSTHGNHSNSRKKKETKDIKLRYPRERRKEGSGDELLCRTRRDHIQFSPEQLWGYCPPGREAELPNGRSSGWHPALAAVVPLACRQPWPLAVGREKDFWGLQKESAMLHWRLQRHMCIDAHILNH